MSTEIDLSGSPSIANIRLSFAVAQRKPEDARTALAAGADANTARDVVGARPLLVGAAGRGDAAMCLLLLNAGAEINAADSAGRTALHTAVAEGHGDVVAVLLANGADAERARCPGGDVVMVAAQRGHTDILRTLLEHGLNADVVADEGRSALMWAVMGHHEAAARVLMAFGADPTRRDASGATTEDIARRWVMEPTHLIQELRTRGDRHTLLRTIAVPSADNAARPHGRGRRL